MSTSSKQTYRIAFALAIGAATVSTGAHAEDRCARPDQLANAQTPACEPASRNSTVVGHTSSGVPIVDVSLKYGVSAGDLDLASNAGAAEFSKRVSDAAQAACKELIRQYPNGKPDEEECVSKAVDQAMVKVRKLVAAAQRKNGLISADQRPGQEKPQN